MGLLAPAFFLVLVAEVLSAPASSQKCLFHGSTFNLGETFEDPLSCNTCTCLASGGAACTKVYCPKTKVVLKEVQPKRELVKPGFCQYGGHTYKSGEGFKSVDGCNSCGCSENGFVMCTMRACMKIQDVGRKREIIRPGFCLYGGHTYKSGDSFKSIDGCNGCGCSEHGEVMCTELACLPKQSAPSKPIHSERCFYNGKWFKAGERTKSTDGCNTCSCEADMRPEFPAYMSCTEMACFVKED